MTDQLTENARLRAETGKLGRFGHHPDPAIDFEIEVETLIARLFDAKCGIGKHGTDPESIATVAQAINGAMDFRVGGDPGAIAAKATLRELWGEAVAEAKAEAHRARMQDEGLL